MQQMLVYMYRKVTQACSFGLLLSSTSHTLVSFCTTVSSTGPGLVMSKETGDCDSLADTWFNSHMFITIENNIFQQLKVFYCLKEMKFLI